MTRDEIIKIAGQAGGTPMQPHDYGAESNKMILDHDDLVQFAKLLITIERKECMVLHDHEDVLAPIGHSAWGEAYQEGWIDGTCAYRDAIRSRGDILGEEE